MNYYYLFGIPVLAYIGYQSYNYSRRYLTGYVMERVKEELDKRMEREDEQEHFKPLERSLSAKIKVIHAGKTDHIFVPYDRRKSLNMLTMKVYLIKNGEKIEITQKAGIPYLICAKDMGGEEIIAENIDASYVKRFDKEERPMYIY